MDNNVNILECVKAIYKAIDDKKGENISVIDVSKISPLADYFILATADNIQQMKAIRDNVEEAMMAYKTYAKSVEGDNNSTWILIDYKDIVVNIFNRESRTFYNLDKLWSDGADITESCK